MRLLRPYNPLVYPVGRPGFDPSHPASNGAQPKRYFIGYPSNGTYVSTQDGSAVGAVTPFATGKITAFGPAILINTGGADKIAITGLDATTVPPGVTYAAFVQWNAFTGGAQYQTLMAGSGSQIFGLNLTAKLNLFVSSDNAATFGPALNTPYFVCVSASSAGLNLVMTNLLTGQVFSQAKTGVAVGASNGSLFIGNSSAGTQPTDGLIGNVAYLPTYLSMPQVLAWAADPWSFWYPPAMQQAMFSGLKTPSAGPSFIPAWAIPSNRPVIGTGTY